MYNIHKSKAFMFVKAAVGDYPSSRRAGTQLFWLLSDFIR